MATKETDQELRDVKTKETDILHERDDDGLPRIKHKMCV